ATVAYAVDFAALADKKEEKKDDPFGKYLKGLAGAAGSLKAGDDLAVKLTVLCTDEETADDVRKLIEGILVVVKRYGMGEPGFPKEALDVTRKVRVTTEGKSTHVSVTVPAPVLASAVRSGMEKKAP